MPKRKRRDLRHAKAAAEGPPVDRDVALFAKRQQDEIDARKARQRQAAEDRKRAEEHTRLQAAKDSAASALKAVRRKERIRPGEVEAAEEAYKAALADLLAFETGERPTWAPSVPSESESADGDGDGDANVPDPVPDADPVLDQT